jgi:diguanylate cyclase (GGDEF)-like protein/PAS domain S-box-containing protein
MASGPPFQPPPARLAAVNDAIEAWSVFEQFFVLSYRVAPGSPVLVNDLSVRSAVVLGISPGSAANDSALFARLLHPDDRERVITEHWDAAANGEPFVSEYRMVAQDGTVLWIYDKGVPVVDIYGKTTLSGHCLDITPRSKAAAANDAEDRFRSIVGDIPGAVYRCACDDTWTVEFMSDPIEDLVGYPATDFVDNKTRSYESIIHPDDLPQVRQEVGAALERGSAYSLEYRVVHANGETRWIAEHGRATCGPDGATRGVTGVILDITRPKAAEKSRALVEKQLLGQDLHDSLTGLPNRVLFSRRVFEAILDAQRGGSEFAVVVIDLDRFKAFNDTLGHATGDRLLEEIGHRLYRVVRESDSVARLGGDMFAVLVPEAHRRHVVEVIRRVCGAIDQPIDLEGLSVSFEASFGISVYPRDGADADSLLRCADTAMHVAKDTHLGHAFYDVSVDMRAAGRLDLVGELRRGIGDQELVIHYQPEIAVRGGRIIATEALVRWDHPGRGLMLPAEFIPVAQETSLIRELTLHVVNEAGRQWREWADEGRRLPIAVNLSMRDLADPGFPGEIAAMLGKWRMPVTMLKLEITESSGGDDPKRTDDVMERLGAMGLRLSVDDFGAGQFSLPRLRRLPIDEIKIDRPFVSGMSVHDEDEIIVRSTIELAHGLGMKVVAEGVETRAVMERLSQLGCDVAQGYYLGRPMPPEEFALWLDHHLSAGEPETAKRRFRKEPAPHTVASA